MILALALIAIIGDSNSVPWFLPLEVGYPALVREAVAPTPVTVDSMPGMGLLKGAPSARRAVRRALHAGASVVVLELGTADVNATAAPAARIARSALRRWRQIVDGGARAVIVPCLQAGDARCDEVRRLLAAVPGVVDVSWIRPRHLYADGVHLRPPAHARLAEGIVGEIGVPKPSAAE